MLAYDEFSLRRVGGPGEPEPLPDSLVRLDSTLLGSCRSTGRTAPRQTLHPDIIVII